ncbi:MAG: cell division protein ZapB [Deltaproteobacteria bacterium]|nr:cell division protein ZapB [Deltaproteobacteria bacterium]
MDTANFEKLEQKINTLLRLCESMEAEKKTLKERLKEKESEIEELKRGLARFEEEKGLVRGKVEGLLTRLDGLIQNA